MTRSIFTMDDRQWTQVRAALMFWLEIAEHSRAHPSRHPRVMDMFKQHGPMNASEIKELIDGTPEQLYLKTADICNATGLSRVVVCQLMHQYGLKPVMTFGRIGVYRADHIAEMFRKHDDRSSNE